MIEVVQLTKQYGRFTAVDGVSFSVGRGEVIGFLGPNGAGKTTTMRMLATYMPPTSGRVRMAGHDALDEPLAVRRKLGYLPESVPLYPEMRVREFLLFRARLKDVPRSRRRAAVGQAIASCRLGEVEQKPIGTLSKGFRQRVGLADALVHDPEILILDEPTSGLDPIQIREVRDLIRDLGARHTILLSTHIMQEVEAVCGRVIALVGGRIAMDDPLERLRQGSSVVLEVRGPHEAVRRSIESVAGVGRVRPSNASEETITLLIEGSEGSDPREELARHVVRQGWGLVRLDQRRSSLEERFVEAVRTAAVGQAPEPEAA